MDDASKDHIAQTALLDECTSSDSKVMYYIHKSLNGRRDAKNNRIAGTFDEGESPWQFQADFVEQRAEFMCRRITRDCPSDLLYYGRPLGLISCVQADLPAYEYWGKHGFCEYCWVEKEGTKEYRCNETGTGATMEVQLPVQDVIGLHNPMCSDQYSSTRASPPSLSSSVIAFNGADVSDSIAAVNQLANVMPMPTTGSASLLLDRQVMRTVGAAPHIWPFLPNSASLLRPLAASLRPGQAVVDRRLAALRSSRINSRTMPFQSLTPHQEPFFWP